MARSFNGTSDRIDVANESVFDIERTSPFSVALWVYLPSLPGTFREIVSKVGAGGTTGWAFHIKSTGVLSVEFDGTTEFFQRDTTAGVSTLAWHPVGFTSSGVAGATGVTIYVDGAVAASSVGADNLTQSILNAIPLQFGCAGGSGAPEAFFNGTLAEAGIWNVELTSGNFASLYNSGLGASALTVQPSALLGYWPLCGLSNPEPDAKAGNNGTVVGATQAAHPIVGGGCSQPNMPVAARIRFSGG
jgi:concanavalin A-like lectin/glucanase superfamily protein